MKRLSIIIFIIVAVSTLVQAQDWVDQAGMKYNCEAINKIVAAYGDEDFSQSASTVSTTVADWFSGFFPACPIASEATSAEADGATPENTAATETSDSDYSFNSGDDGLQPVLGPISLSEGIHIFTATTDGYMIVSPTSLSGDCGSDLRYSIFSFSDGEGSSGAQSVVNAESDCNVLLEVSLADEEWTLDIRQVTLENTPLIKTSDGNYSFNSIDDGLQPVLGPIFLSAGVHIFTATTDGYMIISPISLSGDCGSDLRYSIFSFSDGEGSSGAQSVVNAESDCNVLLEVSLADEEWTLGIEKLS